MLQNLYANQSHAKEIGVGAHSEEILSLIDHIEGTYSRHRLGDTNVAEEFMVGVPVAPGVAEGYALVIETAEDLQRVTPESILICPSMSPVYSVVFKTARGIISEQGGITSTAATVARENSLPAVTGVRSARKVFSNGDKIRIDGTKGCVQINV